jgi:hypothetical protein
MERPGSGSDFHAVIWRESRASWHVRLYTGTQSFSTDHWTCLTERGARLSARRWVAKQRRKAAWRTDPQVIE